MAMSLLSLKKPLHVKHSIIWLNLIYLSLEANLKKIGDLEKSVIGRYEKLNNEKENIEGKTVSSTEISLLPGTKTCIVILCTAK